MNEQQEVWRLFSLIPIVAIRSYHLTTYMNPFPQSKLSILYPYITSPKMDSIVETQRQTHEELERYEAALAEVLMQNPTVVSCSSEACVRR